MCHDLFAVVKYVYVALQIKIKLQYLIKLLSCWCSHFHVIWSAFYIIFSVQTTVRIEKFNIMFVVASANN